jgi:hypothetical protein
MAEKRITNQAQIDAANRANAAAAERKAQLERVVTETRALNQPIFNQALGGARNVTSAINTFLTAAQNPGGIYDPISGKVTKSAAQLKQEADTAKAAISGSNRLGGLTAEQIKLSKGYNQTIQDALTAAGNIQFVNVPSAVYDETGKSTGRNSAYDLLLAQFQLYGLGALVEPLKALITDDTSEGELTLLLRQTEPYKKRFAANAARIGKGLRALSEAEYLTLEDNYQKVMRNYGLPASYYARGDLGRQEGFEKFIASDVSATELEDRIMTAQNRVLNAAPEITTALKEFYPDIKNSDILAYTLDPERGLADIKRKVTAAEIGGAALGARLGATVGRAEELARYGVTAETARAGFGVIGGGLERGRQLASIYQQPDYTQAIAEEEVFNLPGQTSAREKRKKIIGLEEATFGGQTGLTAGALSRDRAGQY